jgi:hypothetical protein
MTRPIRYVYIQRDHTLRRVLPSSPIILMAPHEFDEDHVPGTVYLVDINHEVSTELHDHSHHDIVLVPHPSSDPNDPLNWTHRRKLLAVSMAYLYVFGR